MHGDDVTSRDQPRGSARSRGAPRRTRVSVAAHREDVLRRLLASGVSVAALRVLLPERRRLLERLTRG